MIGSTTMAKVIARMLKQLQLVMLAIIAVIVITFVMIFVMTTTEVEKHFSSSTIHSWVSDVQADWFVHVIGTENRYFQMGETHTELPSATQLAFELTTSINLQEPRTLLGREVPGFSAFDAEIIVAGEGTDYTTMPMESAPPPGWYDETYPATPQGEEEEGPNVDIDADDDPIIHIVHTHDTESFLPEIEGDVANHSEINIVQLGKYLGEQFRSYDLPVEVSEHSIESRLHERGLSYSQSYDVSREIVTEAIDNNESLEFFFDIHRDSQPKDITTATINGESYARTMFVIGQDHPNYERNLAMATELHHRLEDRYPGLSRGVIASGGAGVNGIYNQDLSPNSTLIEFGGVDNNFEELHRSADVMADVIQEYIYEQLEGEE
ncbi:stage II sporulation protein P [Geomicrobium sp. JCM 19038]|uniref:stage II sporulation protein P n=1 Tax=Geomicrobium sp. JCM 19038 TaxID=1460635 RepID=UPI00045F4116|nr:stage II sporulation protein P [Geomicrobium sp. JCM 19038]GAK07857.1 stage II sporulation protein P [Geomicrobium sp. JCM 19038]